VGIYSQVSEGTVAESACTGQALHFPAERQAKASVVRLYIYYIIKSKSFKYS